MALKAVFRSGRTRKLKLPSLPAVVDLRGVNAFVGNASDCRSTCAPGVAVPRRVTTCPKWMSRLLPRRETAPACAPVDGCVPGVLDGPEPAACVGPLAGCVPAHTYERAPGLDSYA